MFRRRIPALAIALSIGYWLFADTFRRHFPSVAPDAGAIRFAHFGGYEDFELWREVIADFTQHHPDIPVRQEYVVGLAGAYDVTGTRVRRGH